MQIRQKLTLRFAFIVACITLASSLAIYFFSADYRKEEFYNRLFTKSSNTAKLLIEVDEVDARLLRRIEQNNPYTLPNEKIIILDEDGIIYSSDEASVLSLSDSLLARIHKRGEYRFVQNNHEAFGYLFSRHGQTFVVIAAATDIYGHKKISNLRTILIIVFGGSILLAFISGWVYSGRALKPISTVIDQVNKITVTSLNLRVDEGNNKDEVALLARTFNNMLDGLEKAFNMQKKFISNASHEMRTPLTAITGQLEVVMMNERSEEEYREAMRSVLEDMHGLNSITNKLLLQAQASSAGTEFDLKTLRIDDIIWQAVSEITKRNPGYSAKVNIDPFFDEERKLLVTGNEQLLKAAMVNLIENGCKYSDPHQVEINIRPVLNQVQIEFTDQGIGIDPADLEHIFEPFHRGRNAGVIKGHGIGLSLVDNVIKLHGGTIEVASEVGQGSTFTVLLPVG